MPRRLHSAGRRRAGSAVAFTLIELVVSVAILSLILLGVGSAIILVARAAPSASDPATRMIQASGVAHQVAAELHQAMYLTERSARAVRFTIPDRDGDGSPEVVRYAWSGTVGEPLTRQYNDGPAIAVLQNVHDLNFAYEMKSVLEEYPGAPVESSETVLAKYDGSADLKSYKVDKDHWIGQFFRPSRPSSAVSWRVTRVFFAAAREGAAVEETYVQLRPANADNTPTDTVLEQQILLEPTLKDWYEWREIVFTTMRNLTPGRPLCLVLQHTGEGGSSANILYDDNAGTGRLRTGNGGGDWEYRSDKAMKYYVYGTYSTPGADQTIKRAFLTGVRLSLQVGSESASRIETAVHTLNRPEALSAVWEADFSVDPTQLDVNADGQDDWARRDGQPFNPASLQDGVWHADEELDTRPDNDFVEPVTVDVRFRNTTIGGDGAVFWINADWANGLFTPIFACLQLQADGKQTLTVYTKLDGSSRLSLMSVPGLSGGFVSLRLLIDPGPNTVNVRINGHDYGTRTYRIFSPSSDQRFATIMGSGSQAEFDHVRVRVGGSGS
jgi:hypothetical protein